MTRLYIAEKPDVARAIGEALRIKYVRKDGYFLCEEDNSIITWCFGHLLQLCDPEDYDPKYAVWNLEDLPIYHSQWRKKPIPSSRAQLNIIGSLLSDSNLHEVVHAGDPDEEGQLLVDELLDYFKCKLPVKRLLINDNNPEVIRKALARMEDNKKYYGLSQSAEARAVCDQLYGYNLSRAYTLCGQQQGLQSILSIGRVQTPILGLIVRRDRENQSHKKSFYFDVEAGFSISGLEFFGNYEPADGDSVDEKGRLIDEEAAQKIASACVGKPAKILAAKISQKTESPPLPYNLLKLQVDCAKLFNLKPDQVKTITQTLREKYKLITYNRSDCQYLNDEHHGDAPDILNIIKQNIPEFSENVGKANPALKSRAFNNDKVSAHHAIIPTRTRINQNILTVDEKNVYSLIARAYIAQFYPKHEYDQLGLLIDVEARKFSCNHKYMTSSGWLVLYKDLSQDDEENQDHPDLRQIKEGDTGLCAQADVKRFETKPRPLYTMQTLLHDFTRVAKYIKNDNLRNILIEKDKDKQGEEGGIGTPATRDEIIRNLFDKGFIAEKGKYIVSTSIGQQLYDSVPDIAKYPDMTALWHEQQQFIVKGDLTVFSFVEKVMEFIKQEVERVKKEGLKLSVKKIPCPKCGKSLRRIRKLDKSFFWGCTGYKEGCDAAFSDKAGRPVLLPKKSEVSSKYFCQECRSHLVRRAGKIKGSYFWGCSRFPTCKKFYQDNNGKPVFE